MSRATDSFTIGIPAGTGTMQVSVCGRDAWALRELIAAGPKGCTPIDNPAPRWSAYVHKLRRNGLQIETIHEKHGGDFPGLHARYVLRTPIHLGSGGGE